MFLNILTKCVWLHWRQQKTTLVWETLTTWRHCRMTVNVLLDGQHNRCLSSTSHSTTSERRAILQSECWDKQATKTNFNRSTKHSFCMHSKQFNNSELFLIVTKRLQFSESRQQTHTNRTQNDNRQNLLNASWCYWTVTSGSGVLCNMSELNLLNNLLQRMDNSFLFIDHCLVNRGKMECLVGHNLPMVPQSSWNNIWQLWFNIPSIVHSCLRQVKTHICIIGHHVSSPRMKSWQDPSCQCKCHSLHLKLSALQCRRGIPL